MAGKQQAGAGRVPPFGFDDPGMAFDFSALQNVLEDPGIKAMAEKLAQDPAFSQMTQSLQQGLGGAAGRGAASTSAAPPINPNEYAHAMQGMFQNPEFMNMAQELGQKIMQQDPTMQQMISAMNQPNYQEAMAERMKALQDDPEIANMMKEVEAKGPSALMNYWSDPVVLEKMSRVMGDNFTPEIAAAAPSGEADDEEAEDGEEEADEGPPLHGAAADGDIQALEQLLKDGEEVDAPDAEGRTALQFACGFGKLECAEALLKANANIEAADANKNTALHYAAGYGEKKSAELLLKHNADKTKKNVDDKTPYEIAQLNEHDEMAQLLKP